MIPWVKKYQPKSTTEIIGQKEAIEKVKRTLSKTKPIILYGPTGVGKTSLVHSLAKELNLEILEINSSDVRNKENINQVVGNSLQQQSLFFKGKIILIDEIDALSGTKDRGCIQAITALLKDSKHPIVFTCSNPYDNKLSNLRQKCTLIELPEINSKDILTKLKDIAKKENIKFAEEDIKKLSQKSKGDLRAAINDLQSNIIKGELKYEIENERDTEESITYCLNMIFKSRSLSSTLNIFDKAKEDLDTCVLWLDENLPKEYNSEELKRAYENLSRADVFKGRIMRWQHWRYLIYINTYLTSGVALSKDKRPGKIISYKPTGRILKLWQAKMRNAKKKSISTKLAEATHTSVKRAIKHTFPYLKNCLHDKKIQEELNLAEDEISWIEK